ncbi:MAG: family transposase [Clostridiaceae bacterium]|jgi:transposase|nr:family transposase [Clostridiaceae bacterium]
MLKIVHQISCGINVHKKFVVATIAATDVNNITTYKTKQFNTFTSDLIQLRDWISLNNCNEVCMESTGKYWISIYNVLETTCKITLANPKFIKNIPGKKTDKRDSIWIADLHKHGLVRGSFIPPKQIRELRDLMRYKTNIKLIETVPCITSNSATGIISEIGVDMSVFPDAKHLCSWAGLTPQNNESAGKKKSVRISRAGVYLKTLLIQCANSCIKDKSCPYFKYRYESIKKRRGHKRAIIAIARMLLTCIYNILSNNEVFDESLYKKYLESATKPQDRNIDKMILFLQSKGFNISHRSDNKISP